MKSDRLIGILSVLLQEEKTTAPELAAKFEVSRRTINGILKAFAKPVFRSGPLRVPAEASASWTGIAWIGPS